MVKDFLDQPDQIQANNTISRGGGVEQFIMRYVCSPCPLFDPEYSLLNPNLITWGFLPFLLSHASHFALPVKSSVPGRSETEVHLKTRLLKYSLQIWNVYTRRRTQESSLSRSIIHVFTFTFPFIINMSLIQKVFLPKWASCWEPLQNRDCITEWNFGMDV